LSLVDEHDLAGSCSSAAALWILNATPGRGYLLKM